MEFALIILGIALLGAILYVIYLLQQNRKPAMILRRS